MRFYSPLANEPDARRQKQTHHWGYDKDKHGSWSEASEAENPDGEDDSSEAPSWPHDAGDDDERQQSAAAERARHEDARLQLIQRRMDIKEASLKANPNQVLHKEDNAKGACLTAPPRR